jgi:hypothetical protein
MAMKYTKSQKILQMSIKESNILHSKNWRIYHLAILLPAGAFLMRNIIKRESYTIEILKNIDQY